MQTTKKQKVIGKADYISERTGEIITMDITQEAEGDFNFHKIWLPSLLNCLSSLTKNQLHLFVFLLKKMDRENKICYTQRQMAEAVGISKTTVNKTIMLLHKRCFLKTINTGAYMVNPDVIFKGKKNRRMMLLKYYHALEKEGEPLNGPVSPNKVQ